MTNEEKSRRVAKFCGKDNLFVLKKRGLYYRPGAGGYTDRISEAWILTEDEANKHVYPYDEPVTKHPAPLPDYFSSLDEMHKVIMLLTEDQRFEIARILKVEASKNQYWSGNEDENWSLACWATAEQQFEAFGSVCKLW